MKKYSAIMIFLIFVFCCGTVVINEQVSAAEMPGTSTTSNNSPTPAGTPTPAGLFPAASSPEAYKKSERLQEIICSGAKKDIKEAQDLIKKGAPVDHFSSFYKNSLLRTALNCYPVEPLKMILEAGANPNLFDNQLYRNALHWAVWDNVKNLQAKVELLVKYGADINARDIQGNTSLVYFKRNNTLNEENAAVLQALGENVNVVDSAKKTQAPVKKIRIPDYQTTGEKERTKASELQDVICDDGKAKEAQKLIKNGALVNYRNSLGGITLVTAMNCGTIEPLKMLLDAGANPNWVDIIEHNALHLAFQLVKDEKRLPAIVEMLIKYGADVNARNYAGQTPLFFNKAANLEALKLMVKNGADINARDDNGQTPLIYASQKNALTEETAAGMIALGADKDASDKNSNKAFFYAAEQGKLELAEFLGGTVEEANAIYIAAQIQREKTEREAKEREAKREAYDNSPEGRREKAISEYNRVHEAVEGYIQSYVNAQNKINQAGSNAIFMKGTQAKAQDALRFSVLSIENLLDEHGKYLPKDLYDHILEDYRTVGGARKF